MGESLPEAALAPHRHVGSSLRRKEDGRLVTGGARHVGDIRLPRMLHLAVLRSPFPHAEVRGIDGTRALEIPGVEAVYTGQDLTGKIGPFVESARDDIPSSLREQVEIEVSSLPMPVLAEGRVLWVGQPVAAVLTSDPYLAEDALELVEVEYEPLPPVLDPEAALGKDAAVLHPELGTNLHTYIRVVAGDVEEQLRRAEHRLTERFEIGRQVSNAIETRGVLADFVARDGQLTIWATNNKPHLIRTYVSRMLDLPAEDVRILSPDMGGSFGGGIYSEDILVPFLARDVGRPVRWLEDRRENLMATSHGRDQVHEVEVGFLSDGTIVALRDRFLMDSGAFNPYAITVAYNTVTHLRSQYRIDHFSAESTVVLTNKNPATPVRGAGRPEANFVMERIVDLVARAVGTDPAEVRLRNLIRPEEMPYDMGIPYRDGVRMSYEKADFPAQLHSALALSDYEGWRERQRVSREEGSRRIGIGLAGFIEGSGHGPFEGAIVRVDESGHVTAFTGARPHGQGQETSLAQVVADQLCVEPEQVSIRAGDTGTIPHGRGSFASRTAVMAGNALAIAAAKLRAKILAVVSRMLEVPPSELTMEDGRIFPSGAPDRGVGLPEVARATAPGPRSQVDPGADPGLEAEHYFVPPTATFGSGTHVAVVEVDEETGFVRVLDYVTVDECGRMLNPMIVEGQVQGGVAHGVGNALLEEAIYDADGQLLTTTYMDYLLPTATDVPPIRVGHQEFPSDRNPLGVKGVGEGGAVAAPAAVINAVEDALRPLPLRLTRIPLTPERLLESIRASSGGEG